METYYARKRYDERLHHMLHRAGVRHTDDEMSDWDLFLPQGGAAHTEEAAALLPARIDQWIGFLPAAGWLSNKARLWELLQQAGPESAASMPRCWLLRRPQERADLAARWQPGQTFLLKDPNRQRRRGLRLCSDVRELPAAIDSGLVVAQQLADDLLLLGGRRFHLRVYVLVLRRDRQLSFWVHRDGRVIYAPRLARDGGADAWLTRSVGSDALPAGLPFLVSELAPPAAAIDAVVRAAAAATTPRLAAGWRLGSNPAVDLFGVDVLLRTDGSAYLIEFNKDPDMTARCRRDHLLKEQVTADQVALLGVDAGGDWPGGYREVFRASVGL